MAETRYTFCRICEALCGLEITVDSSRILEIKPDRRHVTSKGYVCIKGLRQDLIVDSRDRLKRPLKQHHGRWEEISWQQALTEIGIRLRGIRTAHGPDAVAMYMGNAAGFGILHSLFAFGLMQGIGSRNLFTSASQGSSNKLVVARHMYGFPLLQPFPDLANTDCLIFVGSNPVVSRMSFVQAPNPDALLRGIEKRGGRVFFVNPRLTESARVAGEQVFIRPGSDVFFFLAFLNELIAGAGVDHARVARCMIGYAELESVARPWTAEKAEEATGIAAGKLREMVAAYREADGAALYSGTGVGQGPHGTLAVWVQEAINAVSGNLDRKGGTLVGRGLLDLAALGKRSGLGLRPDRSRVGSIDSVADTFPSGLLAREIETPGRGQVRALLCTGGNPLLSVPDSDGLEQALGKLDLLVTVDIFLGETASKADYVLPGVTALERPDIPYLLHSLAAMQLSPYLQYTDKVVEPLGEQRDEALVFVDLARAVGVNIFGSRMIQTAFDAGRVAARLPVVGRHMAITPERMIAFLLARLRGGSRRSLRKSPHGISLEPTEAGDFLGTRVATEDGMVNLSPAKFVAATASLSADFAAAVASRDRLMLIGKRERMSHNSWMHNVELFVRGRRRTNYLYMHPEDAGRIRLADGKMALVISATGSVSVPVRVSTDVMPGTVALPHGWGHQDAAGLTVARETRGVNFNRLCASGPESLEALSGSAHLTAIPVEVKRVESDSPPIESVHE